MVSLLFAMDYWFMGERRKRTLTKLKRHRGKLSELFCSKKFDSLQNILRQTTLHTVFELFIQDALRKIFHQLRSNGTSKLSKLITESKQRKT